jgi:hypothetical protein
MQCDVLILELAHVNLFLNLQNIQLQDRRVIVVDFKLLSFRHTQFGWNIRNQMMPSFIIHVTFLLRNQQDV